MEAQHTPGRIAFKAEGEANRYAMVDESGGWWLTVLQNGEMPTERQEANMRRLAACWNACEGLPTELLEKHGVTRSGIAKGVDELTRQRDELLAALQGYVLAIAVGGGDDKASVMAAIRAADNNARALIAKIGGAA